MVKNVKLLEKFERKRLKKDRLSLDKKYKILDAMYEEAVQLGKFSDKNRLSHLKTLIKVTKIIHSLPNK